MYSASVSIICRHTNTRDGTKASTNSTSGLILLLFLDGQAECVQTYMCVCITNLSSYCVSALILPWNSSVCLCPIASYAHAHAQLPIPKTTDSPAADLGPLLVPPAASLGRCVPSQSQGTLLVCWPVQLGTPCDCTWTCRSSRPALLAPQTHQPL